MKNNVFKMIVVLIIIVLVVMATALLNNKESGQKADYVRIHIRANSNSDIDQNLKHKVKKDIIKYLTPLLATAHTKEAALNIIDQNINNLRIIADEVLVKNQASYMSSAVIIQEEFPTRSYGEFVLEKGLYDALIINLGEGKTLSLFLCLIYAFHLCKTQNLQKIFKAHSGSIHIGKE